MIKKSLQIKLILSYLAVAALTVLVVTVFIRLTSSRQFMSLVMEQQAALLKEEAAIYYSETGAWDGFSEYYRQNVLANDAPPQPGQAPAYDHPREIRGKHGLVDAQYRALIPFMEYGIGATVPTQLRNNLIPVEVNGETVAWIIPDQGFQFKLSAEETIFLARTNRAVLVAALSGVAGAVLMGIVLAGLFLRPIRNLIDASQKMAAGDLEQRVPVRSQDELGRLSETFNQMSADLVRSDRQRRQLTADITHDLSTPLQVIAGYMEMLEDEEVSLTPQRIAIINKEIELLRRLVGDLSLLSTVDARELQFELEPLDTAALLRQIHNAYEEIAAREKKQITCSVVSGTPMILADEVRMLQVIRNLVDNAIRYTPVGETISLEAGAADGKVEIRVKDRGPGIDPDDLPYVFDRLYRADTSRSSAAGNMGLGLAIAKALVSAQNGTIHVESNGAEPGMTFVLRFNPA